MYKLTLLLLAAGMLQGKVGVYARDHTSSMVDIPGSAYAFRLDSDAQDIREIGTVQKLREIGPARTPAYLSIDCHGNKSNGRAKLFDSVFEDIKDTENAWEPEEIGPVG